jgi:hypothetical protein
VTTWRDGVTSAAPLERDDLIADREQLRLRGESDHRAAGKLAQERFRSN